MIDEYLLKLDLCNRIYCKQIHGQFEKIIIWVRKITLSNISETAGSRFRSRQDLTKPIDFKSVGLKYLATLE
jgi:hypothetical protein